MLKKIQKNPHYKLIAVAAAVVGIVGVTVGLRLIGGDPIAQPADSGTSTVQTAEVRSLMQESDRFSVLGDVVDEGAVQVRSQTQGQIQSVLVDEGDIVQAGDVIARTSAESQQANVQQSRANVAAQEARLAELQENSGNGQRGSVLSSTIDQQRQQTTNAYRSLLNTDLRAYPEDSEKRSGPTPTITGYYMGNMEGKYIVDVYESDARLGASFEVSGLEENLKRQVNTESPVPLGTKGLYIQFPEGFDTNQRWVVPIPNTRSTQYANALNAYQSAMKNGELAITRARTNEQQIQAQQAQLDQARAGLSAAQATLEDTTVRAPVSGVITDLAISAGDVVGISNPVGTVSNTGNRQIHAAVTTQQADRISVGVPAFVGGERIGEVIYISPIVDSSTQKRTVHISIDTETDLQVGAAVNVSFRYTATPEEAGEKIRVPISALQITASGPQVLSINEDNILTSIPVVPGRLIGNDIYIEEGLTATTTIVTDARGFEAGQEVTSEGK